MSTRIYTDDQLDRWGEIFRANNLIRAGISFGRFMANRDSMFGYIFGPFECSDPDESEIGLDEFRPLLPRQERAQREADFQDQLNEIATQKEAEVDHDCGRTLCHKRRRTADVRVSDGRLLQPMHPLAVVSARATGGHR